MQDRGLCRANPMPQKLSVCCYCSAPALQTERCCPNLFLPKVFQPVPLRPCTLLASQLALQSTHEWSRVCLDCATEIHVRKLGPLLYNHAACVLDQPNAYFTGANTGPVLCARYPHLGKLSVSGAPFPAADALALNFPNPVPPLQMDHLMPSLTTLSVTTSKN